MAGKLPGLDAVARRDVADDEGALQLLAGALAHLALLRLGEKDRLAIDLTGLPPTWEEASAFSNDRRPDAYELYVDQMLAKQSFGERWARHWLDVARYGESNGFEYNEARHNAWPYRDWVINAFNRNKRFDEFTVEQLAGDELAGSADGDRTPAQIEKLTATGFLRMAALAIRR